MIIKTFLSVFTFGGEYGNLQVNKLNSNDGVKKRVMVIKFEMLIVH